MFKKILVPLDGSMLAEKALPYAVRLANRLDAQLYLVRAVEAPFLVNNSTQSRKRTGSGMPKPTSIKSLACFQAGLSNRIPNLHACIPTSLKATRHGKSAGLLKTSKLTL